MDRLMGVVVEDDPLCVEEIKALLEAMDFNAQYAANQQDAQGLLAKITPDFIILDRSIPVRQGGMSIKEVGDLLLGKIKDDARLAAVPVVVLTGHDIGGPNTAVDLIRNAGAYDFVAKGDNQKTLRHVLERLQKKPATTSTDAVVTLDQFMLKYCEPLSKALLPYRRAALLKAARKDRVELPTTAVPHSRGGAKRFRADDLIARWPDYINALLDLPMLRTEYRARQQRAG